jgi:uncharacterized membrane protein
VDGFGMVTMRLIILAAALAALITAGCGSGPQKGVPVTAANGEVRIDVSGISPGETSFFRYESAGGAVSVFLVSRTGSGELKAALDACVTCYPHEKGYRAEEDCVVCIYCDQKFTLDELGTGRGNCIPVALGYEPDGGHIVMREQELIEGSRYFPSLVKR